MEKTTLLTQFVRKYPQHALSLFIRDTSRWTSAPEQVRDAILALLPFGNPPHFRFLLASAHDQLAMLLLTKAG